MKLTKPTALFILASSVSAACDIDPTLLYYMEQNVIVPLRTIGWPIGFFMMAYMGIKWITAESAEDRENAKRGVIYIFIGLILLNVTMGFFEVIFGC
jgi:hypothetical protein